MTVQWYSGGQVSHGAELCEADDGAEDATDEATDEPSSDDCECAEADDGSVHSHPPHSGLQSGGEPGGGQQPYQSMVERHCAAPASSMQTHSILMVPEWHVSQLAVHHAAMAAV